MAEQMYRIAWKSLATVATGIGTAEFTKATAEEIVKKANDDNPGFLHWIEPVAAAEGR